MLNAHADREVLCLNGTAAVEQHRIGIAGAVPDGKNQRRGLKVAARGADAAHAVLRLIIAEEPGAVKDLAAETGDLFCDIRHYIPQHVGANVGLCVCEDLRRRAERRKAGEHIAAMRVPDAGDQLAVRERARAARAELHRAVGVERAARIERLHRAHTVGNIAAALNEQRAVAVLGKQERRKHAAGTHPDDDRARAERRHPAGNGKRRVRSRTQRMLFHGFFFERAGGFKQYSIDDADVVLFARIHAAPPDRQPRGGNPRAAQLLCCGGDHFVFFRAGRHGDAAENVLRHFSIITDTAYSPSS